MECVYSSSRELPALWRLEGISNWTILLFMFRA